MANKNKRKNCDLISIVVPVYNVENYLSDCLDSIYNQTYKNIEIILIDDGSKDKSGNICDRYVEKDKRAVVIHKENGGLSDARNVGIKRAKGKYVVFVDSDDIIDSTLIECLYSMVSGSETQIGICDLLHCYPHEGVFFKEETKRTTFDSDDAIVEMLYQRSFLVAACGKIFPKKYFENIQFPVGILFEDSAIMYKLFDMTERIVYCDAQLYGYMHRDGSITTKTFSNRDYDILIICNEIIEYMQNRNKKLQRAANVYYTNACLRIFLNAPRNGDYDKMIIKCEEDIKKNRWKCVFDPKVRKKLRMSLLLFTLNRKLLFIMYRKIDRWA